MMKVINSDFLEQVAGNSSAFASLFSSIRSHISHAFAESFEFQTDGVVSAKQRRHADARRSVNISNAVLEIRSHPQLLRVRGYEAVS